MNLMGFVKILGVERAGTQVKMRPPGGAEVLPFSTCHSVKSGFMDVRKKLNAGHLFPEGRHETYLNTLGILYSTNDRN